jgi:flagellar biosynthesis/type III secretory pathway protein FliH
MSRVLKGNAAPDRPAIHSLAAAWSTTKDGSAGTPAAGDPEHAARLAELEQLRAKLAERDRELAALRAELGSAFERGEAKGREAGLREAETSEAQRLARLEAGIGRALGAFEQALTGLERLAPALAHEALAGIVGAADDRLALIEATVRHQLTIVEAGSVVHIDVSAADFVDDEALEAFERTLGPQAPVVRASVALKSGECGIKLKLGALEIGPAQQWRRLGPLLQEMAAGEGP